MSNGKKPIENISKDIKIAIIGSGPAGFGAAESLQQLGYSNVTIYEKNNRVGGMTLSRSYSPKDTSLPPVVYDLGSLQPCASARLFKLIKKEGLHIGKPSLMKSPGKYKIYSFKDRSYPVDFLKYETGFPVSKLHLLLLDTFKLLRWLFKYKRLYRPGFNDVNNVEAASVPFAKWIKDQNFHIAGRVLNVVCTASLNSATFAGYADRPMIYTFKIIIKDMFTHPMVYFRGRYDPIREGYQEVWNRVAKRHQVVLEADITKIKRHDGKVTLCFKDGKEEVCDKLIIACCVNGIETVLEPSVEEAAIFNQARHLTAWRAAFIAKGVPSDAGYVFIDQSEDANFAPAISGFVPEGVVGDGKYLYSTLVGYTDPEGLDAVLERSSKLLEEHFGASDIEWIDRAFWPQYNSHFGSESIKNGVYDQFEALQGDNQTYYVGELLSGQSNGICFDYSYELVDRFFK